MCIKIMSAIALIALGGVATEPPANCNMTSSQLESLDTIRNDIISGDFSSIQGRIAFPVHAQLGGSIQLMDKTVLEKYWSSVISSEVIVAVEKASYCELKNFVRPVFVDGSATITQLVFNHDQCDLRFSASGISSVRTLQEFLLDIYESLQSDGLQKIGQVFDYPFYESTGNLISSPEDLARNLSETSSDCLKRIIGQALADEQFYPSSEGIMLDPEGRFSIVEKNSRLFLSILVAPNEVWCK